MSRSRIVSEMNSSDHIVPCRLCGSAGFDFILETPRLDGPLFRCRNCGLRFVELPVVAQGGAAESELVAAEMERLAGRARDLDLVEPEVERSEGPWRKLTARERLDDLRRFVPGGRLLEVGCSTGELLEAAQRDGFEVRGVEGDRENCRIAAARGLECFPGALRDAAFPAGSFTVAALYHVIEHLRDPVAEMLELNRVLADGGCLVIETPDIDNVWFRLIGARWRQFIPDHIFFFDPRSIKLLCEATGFEVAECRHVGKSMSLRLFVNRLGRYSRALARILMPLIEKAGLADRTVRLSFGDVMRIYAWKIS